MARPTKQGIDYFPLDCQFDDKTEMYLIEKGVSGLGVMITIWQMIYSGDGYYIKENNDLHLLVKKRIDVSVNEVIDCIKTCLSRGIFDEKKHKKFGILTSKAIQNRYFIAAKKKKSVGFCVDYVINGVLVGDNCVNVGGNATKEEVEVEEEVKVNGNSRFTPPTIEEVNLYISEKGYEINANDFVNHYEASNWFRGKTKIKNWKACVGTWVKSTQHKTNYGHGGV